MPLGLVRSGDFRNGSPITLPHTFGNVVTSLTPAGNPVTLPKDFGNAVTLPKNFGNVIAPATTPLAAPTFSPVGGSYVGAQTVTLTTDAHATATYYTTDGSTPTTGSTLYSGPITTVGSGTEVIKAFSHGTGSYTDSTVATATYVVSAATPSVVQEAFKVGNVAQMTPNFGSSTTLGNAILALITLTLGGSGVISSITDTAGNTYSLVRGPDSGSSFSGGTSSYVFMCPATTHTLAPSDTLVVNTTPANSGAGIIQAVELTPCVIDSTSFGTQASSTSWSGAADTVVHAAALVLAQMWGYDGGTFTAGAPFTQVAQHHESGFFGSTIFLESYAPGAAGAITATATSSSSAFANGAPVTTVAVR
jgi:hypothetical protein